MLKLGDTANVRITICLISFSVLSGLVSTGGALMTRRPTLPRHDRPPPVPLLPHRRPRQPRRPPLLRFPRLIHHLLPHSPLLPHDRHCHRTQQTWIKRGMTSWTNCSALVLGVYLEVKDNDTMGAYGNL